MEDILAHTEWRAVPPLFHAPVVVYRPSISLQIPMGSILNYIWAARAMRDREAEVAMAAAAVAVARLALAQAKMAPQAVPEDMAASAAREPQAEALSPSLPAICY